MADTAETGGARTRERASGEALSLRWLGAGGAVALSLSSYWAGALPVFEPLTGWYAPQSAVTFAAAAVGYAGLVFLVFSWWRLGRLTTAGKAGGSRATMATFWWWAAPLALSAPMFSRDVYSYVAQGAMAARGMDVYTSGPSMLGGPLTAGVDSLWLNTPAPYGPVFVWLAAHVVRVTGEHVLAAVVGMRVVAVAGVAVVVWAVRRLAAATGVCQARALWLSVLNPLVLVHLVGGAHNDAVMLALMLCGLVLARRGRLAWGAALITLAMLVKVPAGFALLFLIPARTPGQIPARTPGRISARISRRIRRRTPPPVPGPTPPPVAEPRSYLSELGRRTAIVAVSAAVTTVTATAVLGFGYGWLSALSTPASNAGVLSLTSDVGGLLGALVSPLSAKAPHTVEAVVRLTGMAVALAALPFWWWRTRKLGPETALGMALLTLVVLAPAVQPWYYLWGLLPLAAAVRDERARTRLAAASIGLLFMAFLRGQVADVSYGLCCFTGVAAALVTLHRFDQIAVPRRLAG